VEDNMVEEEEDKETPPKEVQIQQSQGQTTKKYKTKAQK
jgi:hypothetical protein